MRRSRWLTLHLLLLLFIAILFFGPAKLSDFGKGLGDGIRHFRAALKEEPERSGQKKTSVAYRICFPNKWFLRGSVSLW
ncbi:MAG TPA: twin-arginine translocase TatA/TatE family subunit [Candidatus Angelobacter sp.]